MDGTEKTAAGTETTKTEKKGKATKQATRKAKPVKEPKPKKEVPREAQVVFAFRLSEAQRDAIHKAAGPGKATRFVRSAALAAAGGDRPAFEELLTQAKTSQK